MIVSPTSSQSHTITHNHTQSSYLYKCPHQRLLITPNLSWLISGVNGSKSSKGDVINRSSNHKGGQQSQPDYHSGHKPLQAHPNGVL